MNIKLYITYILILLLTGCTNHSHNQLYKTKSASYSYIIGDIKTPYIYKEYASDIYITPASCQKTITALLALKTLGSDYRYETKLYISKKQKSIQDVVISFSGDPTFSSEDLINLLKPLKNTLVKGKIILDASIFTAPPHSENIMISDVGTAYGQPISSMNIDQNIINVEIFPTQINELAHTILDLPYIIQSTILTTADTSGVQLRWNGENIKGKGTINFNDQVLKLKISPKDIDSYVLFKVQKILKELKIKGKIAIIHDKNKLPSSLVQMNSVQSEMLKDMLIPALKTSDNLVFDSIYLKILQSQALDIISDWSEGNKIMHNLVERYFAINLNKAVLVDGSGLSRYNRIQPKKLLEILRQGFANPEFLATLPEPGERNSTLEKRTNLSKNIRAKTGYMSGISCLCGYSMTPKKPKAFVFVANNFAPPIQEIQDAIDEFLKYNMP